MSQEAAATPARRAALQILQRVRKGSPFDAARDIAVRGLEERDRRLAHEVAAGVLRGQTHLDALLAPLVPRGLDSVPPAVLEILRMGAYQLETLDRVPAHAAVDTSVDLARRVAGRRAGGFVNAVLRRLADNPPPQAEAFGSPAERLARSASHPEWLVRRWLDRFGPSETEALLAWNNTPPTLVVQPGRADLVTLARRWDGQGLRTEPAPYGAGLLVQASAPTALEGYREGDFVVQDAAQALVVRFADLPAGATIYDACASPGGKTIALGQRAARVLAGDSRRSRIARLRENLHRAGSGREFALVADAASPPVRPVEAVLLDAPCLGTGTFARHPDARWRVSRDTLRRLVEHQARLLRGLAPAVRPGGWLIYATCSIEPEENAGQIERFLAEHPAFRREPGRVEPGLLSPGGDLTILPQRHGMDGAFAARLRRSE